MPYRRFLIIILCTSHISSQLWHPPEDTCAYTRHRSKTGLSGLKQTQNLSLLQSILFQHNGKKPLSPYSIQLKLIGSQGLFYLFLMHLFCLHKRIINIRSYLNWRTRTACKTKKNKRLTCDSYYRCCFLPLAISFTTNRRGFV